MPAHGRPPDKYAQRRAAEIRARRMEARRRLVEATETITAPTAPLPQRKAIKPTSRAQSAARVIVEAMSGLRAVDVRGAADWSHDQDFQLLRLTADGASASEAADRMTTRQTTPEACRSRIKKLLKLYG